MKTLGITLIIIIMSFSSCNSQHEKINKRNRETTTNNLYEISKDFFPKEITNHLPQLTDSNYQLSTNVKGDLKLDTNIHGFCPFSLIIAMNYNINDFEIEYKKIISMPSIKIISSNDTNQIIISQCISEKDYDYIKYVGFQEGEESIRIINRNKKNKNGIPIPIFDFDKYDGNTSTRLNNSFEIYSLDFNPGKILEYGSRTAEESEFMPIKWKNGYSRGFAISKNDKVVIYWVVAW